MGQRKLLFGYHIQNGEYTIVPEEAATVKRLFEMYLDGASYAEIAMTLQKECVPYNGDDAQWDKHKVKRALENQKYTGTGHYPAIIPAETYRRVQDHIALKANNRCASKAGQVMLWKHISCGKCGGHMTRKTILLNGKEFYKCPICDQMLHIQGEKLERDVLAQINQRMEKNRGFVCSEESVRIENAINRQLESGEASDNILSLILKGISARYACYGGREETSPLTDLSQLDPIYFKQHIAAITLSEGGNVTVIFR